MAAGNAGRASAVLFMGSSLLYSNCAPGDGYFLQRAVSQAVGATGRAAVCGRISGRSAAVCFRRELYNGERDHVGCSCRAGSAGDGDDVAARSGARSDDVIASS